MNAFKFTWFLVRTVAYLALFYGLGWLLLQAILVTMAKLYL